MSEASNTPSGPYLLGTWMPKREGKGDFVVDHFDSLMVYGNRWFPRGIYTQRSGRMLITTLLRNYKKVEE